MIIVVDGATGSGKSILTTKMAYKIWKRGEKIYSNYPVFFSKKNEDVHRWSSLDETYHLKDGTLLLDDAIKLLDKQRWYQLPISFKEKIAGHRHDRLDVITNIQSFYQIDSHIRDNCHIRYFCYSHFRFPRNEKIKPILQISTYRKLVKSSDSVNERVKWIKSGRIKFLFISRFFTKELYKTFGNIYLSQYVCQLKLDFKAQKREHRLSGRIYSRELINSGKVKMR